MLAAERQAVRQYDVGALEHDVADIDVIGLIDGKGLKALIREVIAGVVRVHQLDEDRVGSSPVLQPNSQPVRSACLSSLVPPSCTSRQRRL